MKGNKSAHSRRKLISGLLVMVVIFIVMLGWSIGKNLNSWELQSLQPASAESVSVKNKLTAAAMQDLPSAVEPLASASPEVHSSSSAALTVTQLPQANGVDKISKVSATSSVITAAKKSKKTVYITFDDGPSDNTFNVLEILHQEGVKATFLSLVIKRKAILSSSIPYGNRAMPLAIIPIIIITMIYIVDSRNFGIKLNRLKRLFRGLQGFVHSLSAPQAEPMIILIIPTSIY